MNTTDLDPDFSVAIRNELSAIGTKGSRLQRHQRNARILITSLAAVAVLAVTTGAAVAVNNLPGATTVTAVGSGVTVTNTGTAQIDLGPNTRKANSVILSVTCVSGTGKLSIPITPSAVQQLSTGKVTSTDTESTSWSCGTVSRTVHIHDGYLAPDATSITVTADPGTTWKAVASYGKSVTNPWNINANGQTYGAVNKEFGQPDLQGAQATNGKIGYIFTNQMFSVRGVGCINVYESDGTTVIGQFPFGDTTCGSTPTPTAPGN